MLVLARNVCESIIVGEGEDKFKITIKSVRGNQVKIAFYAPKHIPIHREEIHDLIHEQKEKLSKDFLNEKN